MKSDKSVLVIDTPKCCYECDYCRFHGRVGYRKCLLSKEIVDVQDGTIDILKERHKCCPLRPLPSPLEENHNLWTNDRDEETFKEGFNRCLEVITGETE